MSKRKKIPYSRKEVAYLRAARRQATPVHKMAAHLGRSIHSINSKIRKLELERGTRQPTACLDGTEPECGSAIYYHRCALNTAARARKQLRSLAQEDG